MLKRLFVLLGLLCLESEVRSGEPSVQKPSLDDVRKAAEILLVSDCEHDSLRGSQAQSIMQAALDQVSQQVYDAIYTLAK